MTRTADHAPLTSTATLEERLPELLDDVLGRLSDVGVNRILELAGQMVEARIADGPEAHLEASQDERN